MGVPKLLQILQPYAEHTWLGCPTPDCQDHHRPIEIPDSVVVDGPCLAHLIYRRVAAYTASDLPANSLPLDWVPSYELLGTAVVTYLGLLEQCRLRIDRIYFDGYLPEYKKQTRLDRLTSDIDAQRSFRRIHSRPFHCVAREGQCNPSEMIKWTKDQAQDDASTVKAAMVMEVLSSQNKYPGAPAPRLAPFLVPAIIAALKHSKYERATTLVPDEADPYCALRARSHGGLILTADSDLLLYNLGPNGHVAFLDSLEASTCHKSGGMAIKASIFKPADIAVTLRLRELLRLAFNLQSSPSTKLHSLVQQTKLDEKDSSQTNHQEFTEFAERYNGFSDFEQAPKRSVADLARMKAKTRLLDPRLSEVLLQTTIRNQQSNVTAYVWPIFEDATRSPAWEISETERFLAYKILVAVHRPFAEIDITICENRRKGARILPREESFNETADMVTRINASARKSCDLLKKARRSFSPMREARPNIYWQLVGVLRVSQWCLENERPALPWSAIEKVVTGSADSSKLSARKHGTWDWVDIHLWAQVQAALYSLRLLKDVLEYIGKDEVENRLPISASNLFEALEELPALPKLFPTRIELFRVAIDVDYCKLKQSYYACQRTLTGNENDIED